jgi:hypothetical protein
VLFPLVWDAVLDSLYRIQTQKVSFLEPNLKSDRTKKQKGEMDLGVRDVILIIRQFDEAKRACQRVKTVARV